MNIEVREEEEPRMTLGICLGDQVEEDTINGNRKHRRSHSKLGGEYNEPGLCKAVFEAPGRHLCMWCRGGVSNAGESRHWGDEGWLEPMREWGARVRAARWSSR